MSKIDNSQPDVETFPLIAFTDDVVAGLTGLSVRQLRRWDRTGFFQPWRADPNRRRPYSRIYSRDDIIALRLIAKLRAAGVSFAQLKALRSLLVPDERGEWPTRQFLIAGNRLFLSRDDAVLAARISEQHKDPVTIALDDITAEVEVAIERLRQRTPDQIGKVTRNRGIMGGAPIIAGTRIPTETIVWFHDNGYALDWILKEFPRLTDKDVRAAVDFERGRKSESIDPVPAHA